MVEHSTGGEKHSTASRVFPYTSFVLYRFLRALQQNRAQSRLLYLLSTVETPLTATLLIRRYYDHFPLLTTVRFELMFLATEEFAANMSVPVELQ